MADSHAMQDLLASLMHPELKEIDLSLGRMERFLEHIGNPHHALPPVIHVAGTNGKGSTIAFIRAMLEAAGYRCHVYTSPHLVSITERFLVAGQAVDERALYELLSRIKGVTNDYPLTYFEALTAAAFELFAKHPADVVLLEVGLGGRLDATNVIESPIANVITPIGYDHQEFLGNAISDIAYEKAGIIKPNCPVFSGVQAPETMAVLERVAQDKNAPFHAFKNIEIPKNIALIGQHQRDNAALAVSVLSHVDEFDIEDSQMNQGLERARWPGRLQRLCAGELVELAGEDKPVWLDGGHNADAGQVLADWLETKVMPTSIVVGMVDRKDATAFLTPFSKLPNLEIICVDIPNEPLSMPKETLYEHAKQLEIEAFIAPSLQEAVQQSLQQNVLICGSLYLAGYVLAKNS